jgi:hypothetical protein
MNEGVFRDQKKSCGFCQQPIGNDCRIIPFNKDGRATFHPRCWEPFEKSVRGEIELKISNAKMEKEMRWNKVADGFSKTIGWFAAAAVIGMGVWIIVMLMITPDAYVYCQVEAGDDGKFKLEGVREWSPDPTIGQFRTLDEAKEAAAKLGCPLR